MSSAQLAAGTVLDGLTLRAPVRSRAGAVTYDAVDAQGQTAGVTVYDPSCFPSALVLERSLREIRQLQTIAHPRIARVLACGKLPGGGTYEVHQPLPSASLTEHLAAGPLALGDAIALGQQIGEALVEAQKAGVIHRNLGADVVFPSPEGVVVTGFAVGAPLGGRSFGALDAIAPEQVEGKVVDQRTLIYNLAALLVFMLRGRPLFDGDVASVLAEHLSGEVPSDVPHPLPRALAKDPRMRPMMLRQFLGELPGITSGAPAKPGAPSAPPSSRGWTMFTSAVDTDATAAAAATASTPAPPVAAPASAPPSSRGWTMFTKDDGPAAAPPPTPTPAAASAPPSGTVAMPAVAPPPGPAAPPVDPGAPAMPSTRGWTMFMSAAEEASQGAAPAAAGPGPAAPASPAVPPSPAAPSPAAASPPDADAPTPTTRGWTMFMKDDEAAAPPPTPVATATVVHPAAPPAAAPTAASVAPPPATGEAKPSTRGWTMFTKADGEPDPAAAPAVPVPPATAPAITVPSTPPTPDAAPTGETPSTSRGWTLFMEPGTAAAAAASTSPPATPPAATPVATPEAEAPQAGGSKRGWTMFMETPIAEAKPLSAATPTAPVPQPVEDASSDNRGWTVFGTPSPLPGGAEANAPTAGGQGATVPSPAATGPVGSSSTVAAPHMPARAPSQPIAAVPDLPSPEPPPRGKTIIAPGMSSTSGTPGEVTGRTGGVAPMPDTQYFRRGDIPPERPTQRTTEVDVSRPPMRGPNDSAHGDALATMPDTSLERSSSGGRTAVIVVVGVVLVGTAVAAVLYLT